MAPKSPRKTTTQKKQTNAADQANKAAEPAGYINYGEVQAEELEVLKAIYMEDYEEVEVKGAWSKTSDRSFKLRLRSFSDQDSLVVLSVRLTATYPKTAPILEVTGLESYHERTQERIHSVVQNRPKQMLGEVMIHAIASEIQEALEDAVSARQQGTLPSLEEERASAEEVAAQLAKDAEEAETRRQKEAQEEEERVLKQMVDDELNRREKRKPSKSIMPIPSSMNSAENAVNFDQPASVVVGNDKLQFSQVAVLSILSQRRDEVLELGQPVRLSNAPLVAVKRLTTREDRDRIVEIESYLESVRQLRHDALLGLLAFRVDKLGAASTQFVLCSEYADRGSLHDWLEHSSLQPDKARQYTVTLLEALDYIHRNGIAHGSLSCHSVYLHSSNTGLAPRLGQLGQWMIIQDNRPTVPAKWRTPEAVSRKSDIWDLGVVVVHLFMGLQTTEDYSSPQIMLGQADLSDAFDDFLRKCFVTDSRKRPSAFDLLPAEFLRTEAPVFEPTLSAPALRKQSSSFVSSPAKRRSRHNSSNALEPVSRYAADFTELGRLGKGGFGEVVKARNKLDGGIYAVKKVKQAPQLLDQVLSEVMLLNRLNHPYVVRYFSTWVESDIASGLLSDDTTSTTITEETATEEASSDGPRMDFGYQSTGGLDFISSSGYPQIEFGDDDEDESSDEGTAEDEEKPAPNGEVARRPELGLRKSRSDSHRAPSMLYIQMEYCERHTLRDLVRKGMSTDESWRYVRQVTEGLAHIHSHGIIHRDLKPDNVFLDVAGNPKIGDFGLATTSQYHFAERALTMSGRSDGGDMTRSVGTALYVAPELRSSSGGSYTDKVDMYSLGIMFYEMCEEFSTAMERIRAIQHIREKEHELPTTYRSGGDKAAQGKLISCLISHKPSERPTSTELLRSDILPVKIEDETIRQALSGLSDPRSPYHQKMMSALFSKDNVGNSLVKALAWDAKGAAAPDDASKARQRAIAVDVMTSIFRRHGAEAVRRENLFPRSGYYVNTDVVQLLDGSGNLLQLPYDLTLPYARELSKQLPATKRVYTFGRAFRDAYTGGAPRASAEVDFDIARLPLDDDSAMDEAEVLKVLDELADELLQAVGVVVIQVNHGLILNAVLEYCRVPLALQATVKDAISRLGFHQWTWSKVRTELRKLGLPDTTLDDMQQFDFREPLDRATSKLNALFETAGAMLQAKIERGLRSLREILTLTNDLAVQHKLVVAPLASVNAKFYEGLLFQMVLERKNRLVLAAGGRYDSLINAHRGMQTTSNKACEGAVGVAISLDAIVAQLARSAIDSSSKKRAFLRDKRQTDQVRQPRCDVLVKLGTSEGAKTVALRILSTLWANTISAELSSNAQNASEEHSMVVTIRHEASNSVRVSGAAPDAEEVDVPISTLVSHLQQELRERETSKSRPPAFVRQQSHHDSERKGNVQVLIAQHRSKKSNKYHIIEVAQQRWNEKLDEWREAPILAIETTDSVLESIRDTKLSDADSWRRAIQGVQLNERQYLGQIQDILASWRKQWTEGEGVREACLFNFRTGASIYYDVGL